MTGRYTVCGCVRASFSPEMLQAGAVKGYPLIFCSVKGYPLIFCSVKGYPLIFCSFSDLTFEGVRVAHLND